MTWSQTLATVEQAAIWYAIPAIAGWVLAKWKLLPMWREHRTSQQAIRANQERLMRIMGGER